MATYDKPQAPGKRPKKGKPKRKRNSNILQGADDQVDQYGQDHQIKVIDIADMHNAFQLYTNDNDYAGTPIKSNTNIPEEPITSNTVPQLPDVDIPEQPQFEYLFDQSIAFDTDSDWESEEDDTKGNNDNNNNNGNNSENDDDKDQIKKAVKHESSVKSVEHFRIESVTIYGDDLLLLLEDTENSESEQDNEWKEKRKFIEDELLETEENYCKDLKILTDEILTVIFEKKLLDQQYRAEVTSNLPQIAKFHNDYFLPQLKDGDIIEVFNKSSDFLKMYIEFVKEYQKILDIFAIHGNKSKNKKLYKFLKQKRKQKKPLTNLLIAPIQRIPRYLLLLQDIKKRTPSDYKGILCIQI